MIDSISSVQQASLTSQIGYAVAKKSLDAQRAEGDAAIQLLKAAADVSKNQASQATARSAVGGIDTLG